MAMFWLAAAAVAALATLGCLLADHTEVGAGLADLVRGKQVAVDPRTKVGA